MTRRNAVIAAIAILSAAPVWAQDLAVTGARVYTMESAEPIENATLVVRNGRIESVVSAGPVPADMEVIDADGGIVTPGLFNASTKLGLLEMSGASETIDGRSAVADLGAGFDPSLAVNSNSAVIDLARADGITGAFVTPEPGKKMPFGGYGTVLRMGDGPDLVDHARAAVVIYLSGKSWGQEAASRAAQWQVLWDSLEEARRKGDSGRDRKRKDRGEKGKGSVAHKLHDEALGQVVAGKIPLVVFTNRESDIRLVTKIAREFQIRTVVIGGAEAWRVADELAASHVAIVVTPTINLPVSFDEIGVRDDNIVRLKAAGVDVLIGQVEGRIGTTYNAGIGLRLEAGTAVAAGLSWFAALQAVTTAPHRIYGSEKGAGTLASGAPADFVIWSGDPFEMTTIARTVVVDGRPVSTVTRQDLLGQRYLKGE